MNIVFWGKLSPTEKKLLLQRNTVQNEARHEQTMRILQQVKHEGDDALIQLTKKWDKVNIEHIAVSEQEFTRAYQQIEKETLAAIRFSIERIKANTQAQYPQNSVFDSKDGVLCQRQARPIDTVGLYVPGGTAPLVSTVIMLGIPALIAGCRQRILCTPPLPNGSIAPSILVAAKECEIQHVYTVGGAQAIGAMAYGTQTLPSVDKIFGPGNQWVTVAKQLCVQLTGVSIDMPAGPSELLIIADESANADFVAADLLSQAEHDTMAQVFLVTPSEMFANKVTAALQEQLIRLPRSTIVTQSLNHSKIIRVESLSEAFSVSNAYAPEHLSIQVRQPEQYISVVKNAGTVFLGEWTAEALGDYNTGANHVLPTAGFTRTLSGLSVLDFMKWIGFQQVSQEGILTLGKHAAQLARVEHLHAHENAINIRLAKVASYA